MLTGLSAFPLTPIRDGHLDNAAFERLVAHLSNTGVGSIGALGSTGSYAYLPDDERRQAARLAVQAAGSVPVVVGVGAVATRDVLTHVQEAQEAGAAGVLLAPVTYQPLTDDEVFGLYEKVTAETDVPVVVYDNPATTKVTFTDELHARIAALPHITSIKLPGVPEDLDAARERVSRLRALIPTHVTIGVSGDWMAARGLLAGCEVWYSVLAGVLPKTCLAITRAATDGDTDRAQTLSAELEPVWALFARFGSYRVVSAIADELAVLRPESLHHPVRPLGGADRAAVVAALERIGERL